MSVYLFSLPEYDRAFGRFAYEALQNLMAGKDPVLRRIKRVHSEQIPTVQNTMPSGEVVEGTPFRTEMKVSVGVDDVVSGSHDAFAAALDATAENAPKKIMPRFFERIARICEGAGTTIDARGGPLSYELLICALENMEIDFDEQRNPFLPTMAVAPDVHAQWQKLGPPTEAQQRALDELIERKKREFNDRRRHRKLSR